MTPEAPGSSLDPPADPSPGPSPRPDGAAAPRAVARLARQVELALVEVELSISQYRVLFFLDEVGSAAASALAGRLDVTRPSVTALVDGLEARGLVQRHPRTDDRRRVEVVLSDAGTAALSAADTAVARRLGSISDHLDDDLAERAQDDLGLWSDALDAMRSSLLAAR